MNILTDCDGVLVNWLNIYHEWMTREGYMRINYSYELHERYNLEEKFSDNYIRHFNMSAEIEFLPPFRDAIKYVRKMHEEHGTTFHCITAMGTNKKSHILRKRNLDNLFGKTVFSQIDCVERGRHKKSILEKYSDTDTVWIEDCVATAIDGYEAGLRTFLMNHEYNRDNTSDLPEGITRVDNWKEIYEHLFI